MFSEMSGAVAAIISGAFGVAIVALLVSQHAQAPQLLGAAGQSLGYIIGAAVSPVTGAGGYAATGGAGGGLTASNQLGNSIGSAIGAVNGLTNVLSNQGWAGPSDWSSG